MRDVGPAAAADDGDDDDIKRQATGLHFDPLRELSVPTHLLAGFSGKRLQGWEGSEGGKEVGDGIDRKGARTDG